MNIIEIREKLGEGAYAEVYKVIDDLGRTLAAKFFEEEDSQATDLIKNHAKALAKVDHENVVKVICIEHVHHPKEKDLRLAILMEYIEGKTLYNYLQNSRLLTRDDVSKIGYQIIDGIEAIHKSNVLHGDIHEDNILIRNEKVKIIDILYLKSLSQMTTKSRKGCTKKDVKDTGEILYKLLEKCMEIDIDVLFTFKEDIRTKIESLEILRNTFDLLLTRELYNVELSENFVDILENTESFGKAHSQKEKVVLEDILIYPEVDEYDDLRDYKEKISSEDLLKKLLDYSRILIAGEDQSGKTTLSKVMFKKFFDENFIPVYVSCKKITFFGKIINRINELLKDQYKTVEMDKINPKRIVPIIDDFHLTKNQEKHIQDLSAYAYCVITTDDIFALNIDNEQLIGAFSYFQIKEFKPSLRYELIKKWMSLTDKDRNKPVGSDSYKNIDKKMALINSILGKTIGRGIMSSYPFFILTTIISYETSQMPLNQEITSQGYCYQTLIYLYLRKKQISNDDIDTYINFLTALAFYFYDNKKEELLPSEFSNFMKLYKKNYNLSIKEDLLINNLSEIIAKDSFGNYYFKSLYLYYFFAARYFSENIEAQSKEIENIMANLHVDEKAYIAVFIIHHTKNEKILDEIELNAWDLFSEYTPATLAKEELDFFDKQKNIIVQAALPHNSVTPEKVRKEELQHQDEIEEKKANEKNEDFDNEKHTLQLELRRAIKTVEVMGHIIRNRSGSLEKPKLKEIYKEAIKVHLKILSSFFATIKEDDQQKQIITFISNKIMKINNEAEVELNEKERQQLSKIIFWNLNFFVVFGVIDKITHSLGSDKLTDITKQICSEIDTPASFLVQHGIFMWYDKNLNTKEIEKSLNSKKFSAIAKEILKFMVSRHCLMHPSKLRDRQKINQRLGIPIQKIKKSEPTQKKS